MAVANQICKFTNIPEPLDKHCQIWYNTLVLRRDIEEVITGLTRNQAGIWSFHPLKTLTV